MSVTADVFIKFDGNKKQLTKILSDRFQLPLRRRDRWLLGYVEMNLTSRQEAPDYFTERELRAYDFALGGTVYVRSSELGEAYAAHQLIMEVLAQVMQRGSRPGRCYVTRRTIPVTFTARRTQTSARRASLLLTQKRESRRNTSSGSRAQLVSGLTLSLLISVVLDSYFQNFRGGQSFNL